MNAHTPAPWATQTYNPGHDADGDAFESQHRIVAFHCEVATGIQCSADSRLIAAAPDLLAALLQIAALAEYNTTGPGKCKSEKLTAEQATSLRKSISDIARAAIAKTTE
jgi:hypothetical protein